MASAKNPALNAYLAQIRKRVRELEAAWKVIGQPVDWRERYAAAADGGLAGDVEMAALAFLASQQGTVE